MRRIAGTAFASLAAVFLVITFTPVTIWWTALLQGGSEDPGQGQVMVVLAGSGLEDMLGEGSYRRSVFAVREAARGGYQRIVVTGGAGGGPVPSAQAMKNFLVAAGVDASIIEVEAESHSTRENAQYSARLLQGEKRSIALVTSDFHMFRSARLFRKEGIDVVRRPYPDLSARAGRWRTRWEIAWELALESVKVVYYGVRRWI